MDDGAIMERLKFIDATLQRIESERLKSIEEHLKALNGRVGAAERWQAAADAMHDSLNERVDEVTDRQDKFETKCVQSLSSHQSYIDKQEGGMSARGKMVVDLSGLALLIIAVVKLFLFHN